MKNIVIVGGCGFIGSHLCDELLKQKHKVFCVDNLVTGDTRNIEKAYNHKNFEFIRQDATFHAIGKALANKINWRNINEIYYLASIASPAKYLKMPLQTIDANTVGLKNFLEIGINNNIKVLYTSTSEIYGDPEQMPKKESYNDNVNPWTDRSVYDESKRMGETLISSYQRQYGLEGRTVRIFNTYGPRMAKYDGRVIPNFILQCNNNQDVTIYGDGSQTRSFCYVDDTVHGIIKCMNNKFNTPVNIGNPVEYYSIYDIAQIIHTKMNSKSKIVNVPFISENDPKLRKPDIALANKELKWEPRTDFDKGLTKTIKYFTEV